MLHRGLRSYFTLFFILSMQFAGFWSSTWKEETKHVSRQNSDCYLTILESFEKQQQEGFSVKPWPVKVTTTPNVGGILDLKVEVFCQSYQNH